MKGFDFSKLQSIEGQVFVWRPYNNENFISSQGFTITQWRNILSGIDTQIAFNKYLEKYKQILSCMVLYKKVESEPIGMCLLLEENGWWDNCFPGEVISVHGGGWHQDAANKFIYAKAWLTIVHYLHGLGCRVLTNFDMLNKPAGKLILGTGFIYNEEINMYEYSPKNDKFIKLK